MKRSLLFTVIALALSTAAFSQFVDAGANLPALINSASLDFGDYDKDGDYDLLLAGQLELNGLPPVCHLYKYENDSFVKVNLTIKALYRSQVKWIDAENDGDLDFIYTGSTSNLGEFNTYIIKNVNGGLTPKLIIPLRGGFIETADLDKDGDEDIILSGASGSADMAVFRNDCTSDSLIFTEMSNLFTPLKFSTTSVADYDKDGDLDIAVSGEGQEVSEYHIIIYKNNSNFNFTALNTILPEICGKLSWGDYDEDGDPDLLVSGIHNYNEPIVRLLKNEGSGNFTEGGLDLPQVNGPSCFADFDKDNHPDILLSGISGIFPDYVVFTDMLKNDGNGNFTAANAGISALDGRAIAVCDYDGDTDPDVAISGSDSFIEPQNFTLIYENQFPLSDGKQDYRYISLYPNPATDLVKIEPAMPSANATVKVYSLDGKLVQSEEYTNTGLILHSLKGIKSGTYILRLITEHEDTCYQLRVIKG